MGTKTTEIVWIKACFVKKLDKIAHFCKKSARKICQFQKKHYLCIRNRERLPIKIENRGNSSVGRAQPCQGWGRGSESRFPLKHIETKERFCNWCLINAQVAELVDAHVSGACAARRAGSSPVLGTLFFSFCFCWRGGGIGRRATLRG